MARHPQPLELARLKGADKKDPQRYRNIVPIPKYPLGKAPRHIRGQARRCWNEIARCAIEGVVTRADGLILEIAANLLAEYRLSPELFPSKKYAPLIGCLARLGLSPADRTKLNLPA